MWYEFLQTLCLKKQATAARLGEANVLDSLNQVAKAPDGTLTGQIDTRKALGSAIGASPAATQEYIDRVNSVRRKYGNGAWSQIPASVKYTQHTTDSEDFNDLLQYGTPFRNPNNSEHNKDTQQASQHQGATTDTRNTVDEHPRGHIVDFVPQGPAGYDKNKAIVESLGTYNTKPLVESGQFILPNHYPMSGAMYTPNASASHKFNHALNMHTNQTDLANGLMQAYIPPAFQATIAPGTFEVWSNVPKGLMLPGTRYVNSAGGAEATQNFAALKHTAMKLNKQFAGHYPSTEKEWRRALGNVMYFGNPAYNAESFRQHGYMYPQATERDAMLAHTKPFPNEDPNWVDPFPDEASKDQWSLDQHDAAVDQVIDYMTQPIDPKDPKSPLRLDIIAKNGAGLRANKA